MGEISAWSPGEWQICFRLSQTWYITFIDGLALAYNIL